MLALSRGLVIASVLLLMATGLWTLVDVPALVGVLLAAFVAGAAAAHAAPAAAARVVLLFAFVAPGLANLAVGARSGAYGFALLTAFAGVLVGGTPRTRWQAPSPWRVPIAWWAASVAVTWPVFALRDLGLPPVRSYVVLPIVTAALIQLVAALWLDHLLFAGRDDRESAARPPARHYFAAFVVSATVTAAAAIFQRTVDITWLNGEPWISLGRAAGLTGDANPMGVATAIWAPVALVFVPSSGWGSISGVVVAAVMVVGAWLSGARTALLVLTISAVGLVIFLARKQGLTTRALVGVALAACLLALTLVAVLPRGPGSPTDRLQRSLAASPSLRGYAYEVLWRRDGYGLAAIEAFRDHPWFGVGVGRFEGQSIGYYRRLSGQRIPGDYAQNLWRQALAEQGLVGFVPVLWLTVLTLRALVAPIRAPEDLVVRTAVVALGAALTVGYPVQDTGVALTLATLVAAAAASAGQPRAAGDRDRLGPPGQPPG